ncbi:hypothetical protein [Hyphomicrobium nitrativorans]|nr:hypothetical protein [Hyphomicrobium nitrativorans]
MSDIEASGDKIQIAPMRYLQKSKRNGAVDGRLSGTRELLHTLRMGHNWRGRVLSVFTR